ncbi:SMP-30/gluconolactonase/LRE family protein [Aestuariivirga sp.]|uniref:SMP-30/gluconolactonase/LRE family protein n=1 Tax=Aestuariivirga sp. TaxID=2650926 RepID=UPI00301ACD56
MNWHTMHWTIASPIRDRLAESPMWHPGEEALYWTDWYGPTIHRKLWGQERVESWTIPNETVLGSFVFASGGRLLLAVDSGLVLFDPGTGQTTPFANPDGGREGMVYNDSKLDRFGRLWVGTYELTEQDPRGILYCVTPDGVASIGDSGFPSCNGPAVSPDGRTLYFSDSVGRRILAYDVSPDTRKLANRRVFAAFTAEQGLPDGLTIDTEGGLWCALYGGGTVQRFLPDGMLHSSYALPCPVTAAPGFGGPDMSTLFVATGWSPGVTAATDERHDGGAVFALETGFRGVPEPVFAV